MTRNHGEFINVAHIEPQSHIYGPGKRFVIWLQGCSLACPGCWNEEMWSFKPKTLIHRDELLARILATHDIDGITVLGGEPLQQADNVIWLLNRIKKDSNLSTFLYTGYEQQELHTMGLWHGLNTLCDMIAVGRYKQEDRNTNRQWVGSENQALIYPEGSGENMPQSEQNEVEIIIHSDGALTVLGFPDTEMVDLIKQI